MRLPCPSAPPILTVLATLLALLSLGCDPQPPLGQTAHTDSPLVGTPASIRAQLTGQGIRPSLPHNFGFKTDRGETVPVVVREMDYDGDYVAATGAAPESERSAFMLKGDSKSMYGWIVLPDRDLAYEYTTSTDGDVVVRQVAVRSILPVCNDGPAQPSPALAFEPALGEPGEPVVGPPHVGTYDGSSDTNKLQSRPGASKVLFMDFSVLSLAPAELYLAWQGVSSAYSAFEVNVTTDVAVYNATTARNRGKACIKDEDGRSTCYVNSFGTAQCCDIYNKGNGNYQGLTLAHEFGHMMGLDHDGSASTEYFNGFSAYKWVPLMGDCTPEASWGAQALYQWSKGEYTGANNKEDDLSIITKNLPFRADDIADSTALIINGSQVSSVDNRGQIANNTDTDTFTFAIGSGAGHAKLSVARIEVLGGGMLDVDAELQSADGQSIAKSNDKAARTASFDVDLAAGAYKLIVKGGAEGTPENGFSSYASLGFYGISGTITGASPGGTGGSGGTPGTGGMGGSGGTGGGGVATGGASGIGDAGTGTGGRTGDAGTSPVRADGGSQDSGRDVARDLSAPDGTGGAGSGGSATGTGGASAMGGTSGSGGSGGSGGSNATSAAGGSRASGGATGAGGSSGSGTSQAAGGSTGNAGASGAGGSQGAGGSGGSTARNSTGPNTATANGCSCNFERSQGTGVSGLLAVMALMALMLARRRLRRSRNSA